MRLREALLVVTTAAALAACSKDFTRKGDIDRSSGSISSSADSIKADPKRAAQTNVALAQKYIQDGSYETALGKLQKAIDLDPSSADAYTVMGVLYERIRRPKQAGESYARAVKLAPETGAVLNNYGAWLCRSGQVVEADAYFQRALDDPFYKTPAAALANAGACAFKAGDLTKAENYYRRVLEIDPNSAASLLELAALQYSKGDYLRARAFIQRREAASPVDARTLDLAARIEDKLDDRRAAARYRERLRKEFPDYRPDVTEGTTTP